MKTGRNEPCPCGSGKKYKKCCLPTEPSAEPSSPPSPRFRFEAGSYGGPGSLFIPSALCYRQVSRGQWREHFCLVNPTQRFDEEDEAAESARADLDEAARCQSATGDDAAFAMSLRGKGYVRVDDYRRAKD